MAVNLSPYGGVGAQFLDNSGNVLTGGKIFTYAGGTTTPQATYTSSNGTTPHPNPIILDAAGRVPGGEIWLTDGLVYKFILRDANDVLIATYDNVLGINSNFVNFTNRQEIQTATAGQTVFNLTTMQYQPGTNSLSVFVDGINQYGPGAQYAYVETDSDTVTFVNGLHVGAEVKFTTSQLNSSASTNDAFQVSYTAPYTGSVATTVGDKLADTVSVMDFGAVGDGIVDDTTAFTNACAASTNVTIPAGVNLLIQKTTLNHNNLNIVMEGNAKITLSNSDLTGSGLVLSGSFMKITGGEITLSGAGYFAAWLVDVQSYAGVLDNVTIHYVNKPNYTGDGINIPYNTGVVRLNQPFAKVRNCNIYYGQGGGVWSYREGCQIANNRIHDNITGVVLSYGGSSGFGDNCSLINNLIYDNNASTVSLSGEDGILTYQTKGHVISGNTIYGNGEHGTYIQSTDNTITNNVVFGNHDSGLKLGGAFNSTIIGNNCYNNDTGGGVDGADIYIQSPFGNSTVSNNKCSNTAGVFGIRCVWLSGKAVAGEESRMVFDSNVITGTYSQLHMRVSGDKEFIISNNITDGTIVLSQSTVGHPTMTKCQVSNNVAAQITIDKATGTLVEGNVVNSIAVNTAAFETKLMRNTITAQAVAIGALGAINEFSYNNVTYTQVTAATSLFSQSGSAAVNSNKRFIGNKFDSSGGRFVFFTTSGVSGNYNQFINNEFNGAAEAVYTWGTNIQFVGNRALSTTSIAYLRGTNCLITNNLANLAIEFPGSNTVANNLTPV